MKHLTPADYRTQPWANGRGQTVELLRLERDGVLHLRLSMATVAEDGPFSIFPGIDRNLTVISGPGFDLRGDGLALTCAPLLRPSSAVELVVTIWNSCKLSGFGLSGVKFEPPALDSLMSMPSSVKLKARSREP